MSATSTRTSQQELPTGRRRVSLGLLGARFAVVGVWLALIAVYGMLDPDTFLTTGTFQTIFGSQLSLVFLTAALLCTICVGEFVDLSVASVLGLAATLVPVLVVDHGWNVWAATLVGCLNGFLVVRLGVNVIVVTLGMGTLLLGVALWLTNLTATSGLPREFGEIALYREVSRLAGVRVNRIRFGAFVAAGVICGIGGVLAAAAVGGFDPTTSQSYLLPTFAATFLGTAVLQPGRFNPLGTLIAVYFLATGILGLNLLGYTGWVTSVFYGGVLVIAVTVSSLFHRRAG